MDEYDHSYQAYTCYRSGGPGKSEEILGSLIRKPFVPFVPGRNSDRYSAPNVNRSSEPEGYVTRKTVPVASSPYVYGDEYKHSSPSPNQAYYPSRKDGWRQQTSPVHGRPQKVDDFLNMIQIQASRPANGYKDSGNFSSKPTGNTIRNDKYDGYNGARGYDDSGVYGTQGNGYGGDYRNKPTGGDHGYYGKQEGYKPTGGNNGFGGDRGYYGMQEGYKPTGGTKQDNGFGGDRGYYGKQEGYKPTGGTIWKENNDGYNGTNGYGDYGKNSNTEGLKPTGNTTRNDNHDRYQPGENYSAVEPNKPTMGGWTPPPRNGTHLTEATNDIGKAMELLKEAGNPKFTPSGHSTGVNGGINGNGGYGEHYNKDNGASGYSDHGEYGNTEGIKPTGNTTRNHNYDRPNPSSNLDKAMKLVKESDGLKPIVTASPKGRGSQHSESTNKIDQTLEVAEGIKNIVTAPSQTRPVAIEETMPNKDDYRENIDSREATKRSEKFNFAPQPREANYRNIDKSDAPRRFRNPKFGPIINSNEVEKMYNGTTI